MDDDNSVAHHLPALLSCISPVQELPHSSCESFLLLSESPVKLLPPPLQFLVSPSHFLPAVSLLCLSPIFVALPSLHLFMGPHCLFGPSSAIVAICHRVCSPWCSWATVLVPTLPYFFSSSSSFPFLPFSFAFPFPPTPFYFPSLFGFGNQICYSLCYVSVQVSDHYSPQPQIRPILMQHIVQGLMHHPSSKSWYAI